MQVDKLDLDAAGALRFMALPGFTAGKVWAREEFARQDCLSLDERAVHLRAAEKLRQEGEVRS